MSAESRVADRGPPAVEAWYLGLFSVALSLVLTALILVFRIGLPTPTLPLVVGPAILTTAVLGPLLFRAGIWTGPFCALGLFIGCALSALGLVGIAVLVVAAVALIILALRRIAQAQPPGRLPFWIGLFVVAVLLCTLLLHGNKYLNFIADQLLLWGRTDGDIIFHSAIANAYRSFHFPTTGIDGLHWLRYHTEVDALGALIATGSDAQAIFGLLVLRAQVLFPMMVFAIAWSALQLGRALLPDHPPSARASVMATLFVLLLHVGSNFSGIAMANDPLLLSVVIAFLLVPTVVTELATRREHAIGAIAAAALAIPAIGLAKVSSGAVWCAFAGYLILRTVGPRRIAFWVAAVVMLMLFGLVYFVASDPGETNAVWFGTPFFVEFGFGAGNYFLPLALHLIPLLTVLGLVCIRRGSPEMPRRAMLETILSGVFAANVVGLVLQIPSSDAVFFFYGAIALAIPAFAMLVAAAPHLIGRLASPFGRRISAVLAVLLVVAVTVDAGIRSVSATQQTLSATALLKSGDLTYYADDKRRVWRADAKRATEEIGLGKLFGMSAPVPVGAGLRDALVAAKREDPGIAVYIPPQSDFWTLVRDCDGRSAWTMAVAGVPMIDGYVPVQAECKQEFVIWGYGKPPAVRKDFSDAEICERAVREGIADVLIVAALQDRSRDRRLACR